MNDEIVFVVDGKVDDKPARPDTLPLKDIAYVLEKFAAAVQAISDTEDHFAGRIELYLVSIENGSGRYLLKSDNRGHKHAGTIIDALDRRDGTRLPLRARRAIESIHGRTKKHGWEFGIESRTSSGGLRQITVAPRRKLFNEPAAQGGTSVLADVIKAGGEIGNCRALLKLPDGTLVNAKVKTKELTEQLGSLLYKRVELVGDATWSTETLKIAEFTIYSLGQYSSLESDPVATLKLLSELSDGAWEQIDVSAYIAELREGGAEH
ncbi:MAG: hypothetical protein ACO1RT_13165 [Planctomycetaceae bacterium]